MAIWNFYLHEQLRYLCMNNTSISLIGSTYFQEYSLNVLSVIFACIKFKYKFNININPNCRYSCNPVIARRYSLSCLARDYWINLPIIDDIDEEKERIYIFRYIRTWEISNFACKYKQIISNMKHKRSIMLYYE